MTKLVAYPVMLASALGVLACFVFHMTGFYAAPEFEKRVIPFLFTAVFIVWLPTIFLMNRLTRDFKQKDMWKAALRGCPSWMKTALWTICGYACFAAFLLPSLRSSSPGAFLGGFVIFPSSFYAISFCVAYSIVHVEGLDAGRRCVNGHRISPLAKYCEECGAPALPDNMHRMSKP